jgi:hypothetical protein
MAVFVVTFFRIIILHRVLDINFVQYLKVFSVYGNFEVAIFKVCLWSYFEKFYSEEGVSERYKYDCMQHGSECDPARRDHVVEDLK